MNLRAGKPINPTIKCKKKKIMRNEKMDKVLSHDLAIEGEVNGTEMGREGEDSYITVMME